MRLAHFGTFDVPNYGDLLFPLLVETALGNTFDDVVHVSPIGGKPYSDVPASIGYREVARRGDQFDAVLVGGGNILHSRTTTLPAYSAVRSHAYPELWLGAALIAENQRIPLAINAPGAPARFVWPDPGSLQLTMNTANYSAVRDEDSATRVRDAGVAEIVVTPDTALLIRDSIPYFGQSSLDSIASDHPSLRERSYIAVHINDRYLGGSEDEIAAILDAMSRQMRLRICLLAIGPCHGDDVLVARVGGLMVSDPIVLSDPTTVTEIAHLIAGSAFYVGSSLHGFITATSFGVPAYLVTPGSKQHKFNGFLEHVGRTDALFHSWSRFLAAAPALRLPEYGLTSAKQDAAEARVRAHWASVSAALKSPARSRVRSAARGRFELVSMANRNRLLVPIQAVRRSLRSR